MKKLTIATRKSPLALAQTNMVAARLHEVLGVEIELLTLVTTGDKQKAWSLETKGGKGLFTKELEEALLNGDADVAVHSAKDLPGDQPAGLKIAGYLPRADPRDVLVVRQGIEEPRTIATSSPRRRLQLGMKYPHAEFTEIRGNVDTRLRKIGQDGVADATVLAAAGLQRLGIGSWPGVEFRVLGFEVMVPAVAQAAIAIQSRLEIDFDSAELFDRDTAVAVELERAFQTKLEGGCQTALGVHVGRDTLWFFHEQIGLRSFPLSADEQFTPVETASNMLSRLGFYNL
ncbi:hydroxymethylbilane synthase [Synoicihabitans lomoniglobus]|uniref:Hydroxymethylbilane synthase n=1 Tax=Synoicihabitans lomoniglobus TaxID=2909285 RepID=A0AAF0I2W7_9BACT|nr:hydroxymethylbilane synthase [Opitutaceae bacterium LMO-M01]WED66777.1 hydroxymethylbilane synthase [Opitutaceae bacterium LMO-M01]